MNALEQDVQPVLKELAELEISIVLEGDYDLKTARQRYFVAKQVLHLLMVRRS